MGNCIFCKIADGSVSSQIVFEDEQAIVFKDLNPVAPTHLLVIPKKHVPSLSAAGEEDTQLLGHLQATVRKVASEQGLSDFRVVTNNGRGAGQSVDHLHYHVLSGRRLIWPPG